MWYLGEDSFDFVNGNWERSDGSWEAGVDGAKAGLIMEAQPQVGDVYRQEYYAGHAEDNAEVIGTDQSIVVPYGGFQHALETSEWTPLENVWSSTSTTCATSATYGRSWSRAEARRNSSSR